MTEHPYELVISAQAARAISETLPEAVAFAVIAFTTGPLVENPERVGHELRGQLAGTWSARRGDFRILYEIDDARHEVVVLRVAHRRDVYRT